MQGRVEEVLDLAVFVEGQAGADNVVQRGAHDILDLFPGRIAAGEGGGAHGGVGVFHQRAALRHGPALDRAVGSGVIELELASQYVVKTSPGSHAVDIEVGGEHLFGR